MRKKNIKTLSVIAPSVWACYLIYGDSSGLEQEEIEACDNFLNSLKFKHCINATDCGFMHIHDAYQFSPLAGDCCEYVFMA